ncbi:MAG TPA: hypothetical protein DEH78_08610, partial [Solibacterales bacterium]|nr:hypothetical protein [Bryobacterales bacterium]
MILARWCAFLALAAGAASGQPERPELVVQGGGSDRLGEAFLGGNDSWLAVSSATGVRIYDLASGRVSQEIRLPKNSSVGAHPAQPLLAVASPGELSLKNLTSGAYIWTVKTDMSCSQPAFLGSGETLRTLCRWPPSMTSSSRPAEIRDWDTASGKQLRSRPSPVGALVMVTIGERFALETTFGPGNSPNQVKTIDRLVDLESGTGKTLDLPPHSPGFSVQDDHFVTPSTKGFVIVDGRTGSVRLVNAPDLPYTVSPALSRDGSKLVLVQNSVIVIVNTANPSDRRTIGDPDAITLTVGMAEQMATFGAPAVQREVARKALSKPSGFLIVPRTPVLLENGRLLAVRAADLAWDLFDVATGNRLPFRQPAAQDHLDWAALDPAYQILNARDLARLQSVLTGRAAPLPSALAPKQNACRSPLGGHIVEVQRTKRNKLAAARWEDLATGRTVDLLAIGVPPFAFPKTSPYEFRLSPCSLSSDGRLLAVEAGPPANASNPRWAVLNAGTIAIYDVPAGRLLSRLQPDQTATNFEFTPD